MGNHLSKCFGSDGQQLNPKLWQKLPQDLLECVISKLPFSRVVAFRTVCKKWYSQMIPRAAPCANNFTLLYFDLKYYNLHKTSCAQWQQVCCANSDGSRAYEKFQFRPKSFPSPRSGESVVLVICEEGLLFFGFKRDDRMVRDIVTCNPLTGQSRRLGLPSPLRAQLGVHENRYCDLLVGVVFDSTGRSYRLVVAGRDGKGNYVTLLYDSSLSTWTTSSSLLPTVTKDKWYLHHRSVCCNGNLFWSLHGMNHDYVLKYDLQQDTWRMTSIVGECGNLRDFVDEMPISYWQIACYKGNVLLWHGHPIYVRNPQGTDGPCRYVLELEWVSDIKAMPQSMVKEIDSFFTAYQEDGYISHYFAFSQRNLIFHVALTGGLRCFMKIIAQNTDENVYTELSMQPEGFRCLPNSAHKIWSFLPSLTTFP